MGYSKSRVTLNRRMKEYPSFFDAIAHQQVARLVGKPDESATLAYKLREALYVASVHKQHYPELASAHDCYAIEILDARTVQARPKKSSTEDGPPMAEKTPVQGLDVAGDAGAPQIISGLKTATDVIAHCIRRLPTNDSFHFPDAELSDADLEKVWRWCKTLHPSRVIIKPKGTNAITIANKPAKGHPLSHALWRPAEEQEEQNAHTSSEITRS